MKLIFTINKKADIIFDYLTDMQKYVSVHPVITRIKNKQKNYYLVYETLQLGFIPISFSYPATVEGDKRNKTVNFKATIMKLATFEMQFLLHENGDHTIIEEIITIKSLLPIKGIMQRLFRKTHQELFNNIEKITDMTYINKH